MLVEHAGDGTEVGFDRPEMGLRYTREVPNALFTIGAQYRRDDIDAFDEDLAETDFGVTRSDTSADVRLDLKSPKNLAPALGASSLNLWLPLRSTTPVHAPEGFFLVAFLK